MTSGARVKRPYYLFKCNVVKKVAILKGHIRAVCKWLDSSQSVCKRHMFSSGLKQINTYTYFKGRLMPDLP